jgi:uroporphyrin-III C-methyltransferase/precorrin-2 dehydrogenase/sirohydrochlorin ferrochelatase
MTKRASGESRLYPLFANLGGRAVLVVGGGDVAERKVRALLGCAARVTVAAPGLNAQLAAWRDTGTLLHRAQPFAADMLDGAWLVVAATGDGAANQSIAAAAEARRVFANIVDDAELSTFHVPAVIDRAPVQVAISSGGSAPVLARRVRERIESLLDEALGPLARLLDRARAAIRSRLRDPRSRRAFYDRVIDGDVARLLRSGRGDAAEHELALELAGAAQRGRGRVTLVGAGPGAAGLLTLAGLRALNEADVILYDHLVSDEVLQLARRDAERIEVGKQAGSHRFSQKQINDLMLQYARADYRVVRLKGGDPFVFGRGGEELEFLREHGVDYAVVPGITAAIGCAAYAGVPLTHRDLAHSVRFATAHGRDSSEAIDWHALAAPQQTVALYMGLAQFASICRGLVGAGMSAATPVAVIENGTRPGQRVIATRLGDLPGVGARHVLSSPALIIIGPVAALATTLHWFGAAPVVDIDADVEVADGPLPAGRNERAAA